MQKIGIHKRRNGTTRIGHEGGREEGTQIISLKRFCCDHNSKKGQAQTEIKGEEGDLKEKARQTKRGKKKRGMVKLRGNWRKLTGGGLILYEKEVKEPLRGK